MSLEVFVLSAGRAPEHDYRWKTERDENHDLSRELRRGFSWLDDAHPSILVERESSGNFRVLVAGFATERRDYRGRTIRNAFLWLGLAASAARAVALEFLRSQGAFVARCNSLINSKDDAPGGYVVDWTALQKVVAVEAPAPAGIADPRCREELLSDAEKTTALIAHSDWPTGPEVLLVATRLPSSSALRELRENVTVWRLHHEQATPQDLPPKSEAPDTAGAVVAGIRIIAQRISDLVE